MRRGGFRVTKTSEDRYIRSESSSSQSSIDGLVPSTRSNIYNASIAHQQIIRPDFKRVFDYLLLLFSNVLHECIHFI